MRNFLQENAQSLTKGAAGILATASGAVVSRIDVIKDWVSITCGCVSILVGLVTIWSIIRKSRKDRE